VIYFKLSNDKKRRASKQFSTQPITGMTSTFQSERLCNESNETRSEATSDGRRARFKSSSSISQSLAIEKGMLSRLYCVGVVPVP
jgi:hypothetical protein